MRLPSSISIFFFAALGVACSSSSSGSAAPIVGVNDVAKACEIRAGWGSLSATACNNCIALSTTPKCACSDQEYAGKCNDQTAAKRNEATCAGTDDCVQKCAKGDCTCVEACYANKATCRSLASAADGCVAQECDSYCK